VAQALAKAEKQHGEKQAATLTRLAAELERDAARSSDSTRVRRLAAAVTDLASASH
jgi:uncharacterized membrane-anchored protein